MLPGRISAALIGVTLSCDSSSATTSSGHSRLLLDRRRSSPKHNWQMRPDDPVPNDSSGLRSYFTNTAQPALVLVLCHPSPDTSPPSSSLRSACAGVRCHRISHLSFRRCGAEISARAPCPPKSGKNNELVAIPALCALRGVGPMQTREG